MRPSLLLVAVTAGLAVTGAVLAHRADRAAGPRRFETNGSRGRAFPPSARPPIAGRGRPAVASGPLALGERLAFSIVPLSFASTDTSVRFRVRVLASSRRATVTPGDTLPKVALLRLWPLTETAEGPERAPGAPAAEGVRQLDGQGAVRLEVDSAVQEFSVVADHPAGVLRVRGAHDDLALPEQRWFQRRGATVIGWRFRFRRVRGGPFVPVLETVPLEPERPAPVSLGS